MQVLKPNIHMYNTKSCPLCLLDRKLHLAVGGKTAGVVWTNHLHDYVAGTKPVILVKVFCRDSYSEPFLLFKMTAENFKR